MLPSKGRPIPKLRKRLSRSTEDRAWQRGQHWQDSNFPCGKESGVHARRTNLDFHEPPRNARLSSEPPFRARSIMQLVPAVFRDVWVLLCTSGGGLLFLREMRPSNGPAHVVLVAFYFLKI